MRHFEELDDFFLRSSKIFSHQNEKKEDNHEDSQDFFEFQPLKEMKTLKVHYFLLDH